MHPCDDACRKRKGRLRGHKGIVGERQKVTYEGKGTHRLEDSFNDLLQLHKRLVNVRLLPALKVR